MYFKETEYHVNVVRLLENPEGNPVNMPNSFRRTEAGEDKKWKNWKKATMGL